MSTRSIIARQNADGSVDAIYCHFDGYLDHHAPILLEHYKDQAKVDALIAVGNISVLAEEIGEKHPFDGGHNAHPTWVLAYGRDRGEDGQEAKRYVRAQSVFNAKTMGTQYGAGYGYLFRSGEWVLYRRDYDFHRVKSEPLAKAWERECAPAARGTEGR